MATPIPANAAPLTAWSRRAAADGDGRVARRARTDGRASARAGSPATAAPSRRGCAFVALRGERHDGHAYVEAAVDAGRRAGRRREGRAPAGDRAGARRRRGRRHARRLGSHRRARTCARGAGGRGDARVRRPSPAAPERRPPRSSARPSCSAVGPCHATAGNLNNRVGVPAVAFGLEPHHRFAVFEVGMSVRGEIAALARIVEPDVGDLTNVGVAHAEGVGGTRARRGAREGRALRGARAGRRGRRERRRRGRDRRSSRAPRARARVGPSAAATTRDYRLVEREPLGRRRRRACASPAPRGDRGAVACVCRSLGEAAAVDFAAALAAAEAVVGPLADDVLARRSATRASGERRAGACRCALADGTLVLDDTYNANPRACAPRSRTLAEIARQGRRAVVVLGEMKELGPAAPSEHAALGEAVVATRAPGSPSAAAASPTSPSHGRASAAASSVALAGDADEAARVGGRARRGRATSSS